MGPSTKTDRVCANRLGASVIIAEGTTRRPVKKAEPVSERPAQSTEVPFDYDSIPPGYYDEVFDRRRGIQSKWHHVKFEGVRRAMQRVGGNSVLDIGCGPGTFAAILQDYDYTGVDLAAPQVEYATRKYGDARHQFIHASSTTLPVDDGQFDLVTSVEVIEHITAEQGAQMLSEAFRVLRPGGHMVITTPNYRSFWPVLEHLVSRLSPMDYVEQHICHYTTPRLRRALQQAGFASIRVRSFVHSAPFLAPLGWRFSSLVFGVEYRLLPFLGHTLLATARKPERAGG